MRTVSRMMSLRTFRDRQMAGRLLAEGLDSRLREIPHDSIVVLGIPRGGVPVAAEVAAHVRAPLDLVIVRKLGSPGQPELAMGAVGEGGDVVLNHDVIRSLGISEHEIAHEAARQRVEVDRRVVSLRAGRTPVNVTGKTVVIVDDGLATGSTAIAACRVVRAKGAAHVLLAVPVAPEGWERTIGDAADDAFALTVPTDFMSVGQFYDDFDQVDDDEVRAILSESTGCGPSNRHEEFEVVVGAAPNGQLRRVTAELSVPAGAASIVVFAHGSGSGRRSPRNIEIARHLNDVGIATVLVDLELPDDVFTEDSADGGSSDVDSTSIGVLADRLWKVVESVAQWPDLAGCRVGLIGSSTGAAVALLTAARHPEDVAAVVSRGGRPDLVGERVGEVRCPVLMIVGSRDTVVLGLNQRTARLIPDCSIVQVARATHLFDEPGTLKEAARLACGFFRLHLG